MGEIYSGRENERTLGRNKRRTALCRLKHYQSTNDPSRPEHLIIHPCHPEKIPQAGARISGREKSEPVVKGKVSNRMPIETSSIFKRSISARGLNHTPDSSREDSPGGGEFSGKQKSEPRAEEKTSSPMPIKTLSTSLIIHLS